MTHAEVLEQLRGIIRETFNAPNAQVENETIADDIPGWDSLSHTVLLFVIEEHFGITVSPETQFDNVGQLADMIASRTAV